MEMRNYTAENKLDKDPKGSTIQMLDTDIILGNPKYNCRYHGICEIKPSNTFGHHSDYPSFSLSKARIYINKNDELEILFMKKTISDRTKRLHFSKSFFTVTESVDIPTFVSDFLKIPYTIHSGEYPIKRGNGYYKIAFKRKLTI